MKITPIASGTGSPGQVSGNVEIGSSAGQERRTAAKRAFKGESRATITEKEPIQRAPVEEKRRMVMKTRATPEQYLSPEEVQTVEAIQGVQEHQNAIPNQVEETAAEETKPLSPQFAALARQKRALQVKESELAAREEALKTQNPGSDQGIDLAKIKANPLAVLKEAGVSYDDLTQAILGNPEAQATPNAEIQELRAEIKALKEGVDKNLTDRDTQAEAQVIAEIKREAQQIAEANDEFEMVRVTKSYDDVTELIKRLWKKTGEVMGTEEALRLVEEDLLNQLDPLTKTKKLQGRFAPQEVQQPLPERQMRTLTNRDGVSPGMTAKQRAMAAFNGTLKRG